MANKINYWLSNQLPNFMEKSIYSGINSDQLLTNLPSFMQFIFISTIIEAYHWSQTGDRRIQSIPSAMFLWNPFQYYPNTYF